MNQRSSLRTDAGHLSACFKFTDFLFRVGPGIEGGAGGDTAARCPREAIGGSDGLSGRAAQSDHKQALEKAFNDTDAAQASAEIQNVLDKYCLVDVHINPESRVKVTQGPAKAELLEQGWRSFLVKVRNEAGVTAQLKAESPNALPVYARGKTSGALAEIFKEGFSLDHRSKLTITERDVADRWLELSMFNKPPLNQHFPASSSNTASSSSTVAMRESAKLRSASMSVRDRRTLASAMKFLSCSIALRQST